MSKIGSGSSVESPKFARRSDGLHAEMCKEIRKPTKKPVNKILPDSSVHCYQKITLKIPDEYAFALLAMYKGQGLQYAIMHHIRKTITPVNADVDE